ncbi:MAG: SbcC/MukB-like Walker B domain-containing protein [Chloroflexota bacterium]
MLNLFQVDTGFRLFRLELFNWGTFDRAIWPMTSEGETAVLTGANGSGKSTVVDALLTLLVEGRRRNYNLASGAGSARERSERTYVRGQYSRSQADGGIEAKANYLRGGDTHTVLLAVFRDNQDESLGRCVTLAQVMWISNSDRVEKRYYVAERDLDIETHFPQRHIAARDLPEGVESFGSSFKAYISGVRKALGLSGKPKALDLFNETVAVKDIAGLNSFVRKHMLDRGNPEERVDALRSQYRELNDAHAAIQRAAHQLDILNPLVLAGREYRTYEARIAAYDAARQFVPFYVARKGEHLITTSLNQAVGEKDAETSRLAGIDQGLSELREQLDRVKIAVAQNSVGQMKREIEGKLPILEREIEGLNQRAQQYSRLARHLGLEPYSQQDHFFTNRERATVMQSQTQDEIEQAEGELSDIQMTQRDTQRQIEQLKQEIDYLRAHLSNIPERIGRIRQEIVAQLGLRAESLTFVGELLQVREEEKAWEGVLERLLHSFALELIVPEQHYQAVSRFVNQNNLRGRLVYRRVDPNHSVRGQREGRSKEGPLAYEKIAIKQETPFYDYLASSLMGRFDYLCCQGLADFQKCHKGITIEGQIKHSRSRHEKDDRRQLNDRRNYVLGWDNRAKLRQLEKEAKRTERMYEKGGERLQKIRAAVKRRRLDLSTLENLLAVPDFSAIDWRSRQLEVDQLKQQLAALNAQSDQLRQLENEQANLERQISESAERRDKVIGRLQTLQNEIDRFETQLKTARLALEQTESDGDGRWQAAEKIITEIDRGELTIDQLANYPDRLDTLLSRSMSGFRGVQNGHQATILNAMNSFRREYAAEGASLTADIPALSAYEQIHSRLETDDLPQYEARFKQMLDRHVATSIQEFMAQLEKQERDIERNIDDLNRSLARIDYGGNSIIRLIAEPARDSEIADFKNQLRACIPNYGDRSPEELERVYRQIKGLIERFDSDPNWMRRVTDVRRWRLFAAERLDADGKQIDYYSDSSGKSGGQKAKLAYTILASAIAYQYGLQDRQAGDRSFRFVVIDEAFSKLDDDNARFAMQLFEQLGLQLLVVTPMQQLHILEPYVKAYHIVVNNDEGNQSRLYNLNRTQYAEQRRLLQGGVT